MNLVGRIITKKYFLVATFFVVMIFAFSINFNPVSAYTSVYNGASPIVITKNANYISISSVLLNSSVNPNNAITTAWFEYGQNPSSVIKTDEQPMGIGNMNYAYSKAISGLKPDTSYHFRVVSRNPYGISYGATLNFRTHRKYIILKTYNRIPLNVYNRSSVTPLNSFKKSQCAVLISSINTDKTILEKNSIYTVTYKNMCNYNLSDAFLKIVFPANISFKSIDYPPFNRDTNGISYNLGNISSGNRSSINILIKAKSNITSEDNLMFSSVLNFNNNRGEFESVSSYINASIGTHGTLNLGAFIISSVSDLFNNWIFILLVVFFAGVVVWEIFFSKENIEKVEVLRDETDEHISK